MTASNDRWAPLAAQLRADSIRATTAAGSGHPTSCLSAADLMAVLLDGHLRAASGVHVRVVDLYSVKPIDAATIEACARECGGRLVVVEDHWPEGGLADAVSQVFAGRPAPAITRLAVYAMPGSGTPRELLDAAGIGADAIVHAVVRATESSDQPPRAHVPP